MAVAVPLAKSTDLSALQHPLLTSVDFTPFEAEDLVPLFESDEHSGSAGESTDDGLPAEFTALLKDYNDLAAAAPAPQPVAAPAAPSARQAASPDSQSPSSSFVNSPSSESDEAYGSKTSKKRNTRSASTGASRKKAKPTYDLSEIVEHGVTLTEEFLLTCSLDTYDEIIIKLSAGRRLSAEEEATVVGQRRRVKNRESAQESRDKKKNEVKTLQTEVDRLKTTNAALSTQNERLQSNVERLEKMLSLQQVLVSMWNSVSSLNGGAQGSHKSAYNAGSVVLFVALLSFACFLPASTTRMGTTSFVTSMSGFPWRSTARSSVLVDTTMPSSSSDSIASVTSSLATAPSKGPFGRQLLEASSRTPATVGAMPTTTVQVLSNATSAPPHRPLRLRVAVAAAA